MPANNPNSPDAKTMQGPGPTGQEGYPLAVVPATGSDPFDVTVIAISGSVTVGLNGIVSAGNSSTTPLPAGGTFTGVWEDVSDQALIVISVFSDQRSLAADGLRVQFSTNGVDIDQQFIAPVVANVNLPLEFKVYHQFVRVVYNNHETIAQTVFRLETIYHPAKGPSAFAALNGSVFVNGAIRTIEKINISVSSFGPTEIVTAVGNRFSRILSLYLASNGNQRFTIMSGAATTVLPFLPVQASFPFDIDRTPYGKLGDSNIGQNLNISQDAVFGPAVMLTGFIEVVRV